MATNSSARWQTSQTTPVCCLLMFTRVSVDFVTVPISPTALIVHNEHVQLAMKSRYFGPTLIMVVPSCRAPPMLSPTSRPSDNVRFYIGIYYGMWQAKTQAPGNVFALDRSAPFIKPLGSSRCCQRVMTRTGPRPGPVFDFILGPAKSRS